MAPERETVTYNGTDFHRYPNSKHRQLRVYYWAHTKNNEPPIALHREKYEDAHGPIPEEHVIHHIDGDPLNNNVGNLTTMPRGEHQSMHMEELFEDEERLQEVRDNLEEYARPQAVEWHRSDEGSQWHKEHYEKTKDSLHEKRHTHTCDYCGEEYKSNRSTKTKYCSNACGQRYRRQRDREERTCDYCGDSFDVYKLSETRHCSKSCGIRNAAQSD